jgi:hypothetical protein
MRRGSLARVTWRQRRIAQRRPSQLQLPRWMECNWTRRKQFETTRRAMLHFNEHA